MRKPRWHRMWKEARRGRGGVPLIFPRAKPQIVWSILRLLFLATIVALRLTLRLLIGLAAWLLGAYVQLPPRGARARE
jgi:hypothetical protein